MSQPAPEIMKTILVTRFGYKYLCSEPLDEKIHYIVFTANMTKEQFKVVDGMPNVTQVHTIKDTDLEKLKPEYCTMLHNAVGFAIEMVRLGEYKSIAIVCAAGCNRSGLLASLLQRELAGWSIEANHSLGFPPIQSYYMAIVKSKEPTMREALLNTELQGRASRASAAPLATGLDTQSKKIEWKNFKCLH